MKRLFARYPDFFIWLGLDMTALVFALIIGAGLYLFIGTLRGWTF